jgi:glycosyltransferase involved in cell wall biosynthesis
LVIVLLKVFNINGKNMNINIISAICQTGYGIAGANIVKALAKLGHNIALWPMGGVSVQTEDLHIFKNAIDNQKTYDPYAPCVRIWHQFALDQFVGKGKHIGFPIFELDKFNDIERHHLSSVDELFVCSSWAKSIIEKTIPGQKTSVVPLGVDTSIFYPPDLEIENDQNKPFIFFNAGKWEKRKGHDILWQMFNEAFTEKDNVELWMMPTNPFLTEDESNNWAKLYKNSKLGSKIKLFSSVSTHNEVAYIMRQTNCGIFPSRAEGFGLENLELMACGKPCISTAYAGHTEYMSEEDTFLIHISKTEEAYDGKWFFRQGSWGHIGEKEIEETIFHMRDLYKNKNNSNPKYTGKLALEKSKEFSWENSAKKLIENIL